MGMKNLIGAQIENAFRLLKDLAVDVTLNRKISGDFNFGTGQLAQTPLPVVATKLVFVNSKAGKTVKSTSTVKNALIKIKGIGDVSVFDTVTIDAVSWEIGKVLMSTDNVILVEITRS